MSQPEPENPPNTTVYHDAGIPYTYYLLIPNYDPSEFFILLQETDDGHWQLPVYQPHEHHFAVVHHINDHVANTLALHVATLRCFRSDRHPEKGETRFYALDNLMPDWNPPTGMRWFTEVDLLDITIVTQRQRNVIMAWFDWRHSDHSQRADWHRAGWYIRTGNWMLDIADRMAMTGLQAPVQLRAWARSTTMRLNNDATALYLKAVPPIFNYEPVITRVLSIRYPNNMPAVQGVHVDNGWMLTREWGGQTLTQHNDIAVWESALRHFAKIQRDLTKSTQSIIALGVPDRNVDYLASQIERLMNDLPETLSEDEKTQLKRYAPTLRALCYELVEYNLPLTLTHGDFWSGNVIIKDTDQTPLFFDWSDASISHPFFDAATFLDDLPDTLVGVDAPRVYLLNAYLDEWKSYNTHSNLKRAFKIARVLTYMHQALFYHVHILPGIETAVRWELAALPARQLQQVLSALADYQKRM